MTAAEYREGIYYGTYARMWVYPEGERVSTLHLTDGRFVMVGPRLPAQGETVHHPPQRTKKDSCSQTESSTWYWNSELREIMEADTWLAEEVEGRSDPGRPKSPHPAAERTISLPTLSMGGPSSVESDISEMAAEIELKMKRQHELKQVVDRQRDSTA